MKHLYLAVIATLFLMLPGCGNNADDLGVAGECTATADCDPDGDLGLTCLTGFKGGYCGLQGCTADADCPEPSICVTHDDSVNYCFRTCTDKSECNANRSADNEANCSSSITRVEGGSDKACVPPSA
ncbi:MAG: hypothetical protein P1V51_21475 [Deltaproteobacteria bacterium]|nr:hypothetical protein [Deltaproteobacteria bacterium]